MYVSTRVSLFPSSTLVPFSLCTGFSFSPLDLTFANCFSPALPTQSKVVPYYPLTLLPTRGLGCLQHVMDLDLHF